MGSMKSIFNTQKEKCFYKINAYKGSEKIEFFDAVIGT